MRSRSIALVLGLSMLAVAATGQAQGPRRLNPMIALHEKGLPVLGITHPAIVVGGRGTPTPAPAPPSLMEAARETVAYKFSDFAYDNYSAANAERFLGYMAAMLAAGGSMSSHAFISKIPIVHADPDAATARIVEQLNAGHAGIIMQEVESADEVRTALAAMRFKSRGGTRPDEGIGLAAAYWGLSEAQYREKADPWPMNPNGELILSLKMEDKYSLANIDEITKVPGLAWGEWGPGDQAMSLMGLAYLKSGGNQGRSLPGTAATGGLPPIGEPKLDAARTRIMNAMKANKWAPLHSSNVENVIDLIKAGVMVHHGTSVELTNKGRAFTKREMPY